MAMADEAQPEPVGCGGSATMGRMQVQERQVHLIPMPTYASVQPPKND